MLDSIRRLSFGAVALFLISLLTFSASAPAAESTPVATGKLSLTIVDGGGVAVKGARVVVTVAGTSTIVAFGYTDKFGKVTFNNLPAPAGYLASASTLTLNGSRLFAVSSGGTTSGSIVVT